MAKQSKEEYKIARRNSHIAQRRALDPKLDRQLKDIEGQSGRRKRIREHELDRTKHLTYSMGYLPYTKKGERQGFAESEKKKRINKALAKSHARRKK